MHFHSMSNTSNIYALNNIKNKVYKIDLLALYLRTLFYKNDYPLNILSLWYSILTLNSFDGEGKYILSLSKPIFKTSSLFI